MAALTVFSHGKVDFDPDVTRSKVVGTGSWTRRQLICECDEKLVAWANVHDRAAGRVIVEVNIHPDAPGDDRAAASLFAWAAEVGAVITQLRELEESTLDSGAYATDERQHRWLTEQGYALACSWRHMTRPVTDADAEEPEMPEGVVVRQAERHDEGGMPVAEDLHRIHAVLEESFGADHFGSFRESLPEFVQRLREAPGHRWNQWFLGEYADEEGKMVPGAALVGSLLPRDDQGKHGSYVDYIAVGTWARGKGLARAILEAYCHDAAVRGRNRVDLEVDTESPTHADDVYRKLGWHDEHVTESWHKPLKVTAPAAP